MNFDLPIGQGFPWLAPLAGFSDLAFRLLCREQGAAVACTEMVSAKGLIYGMRKKGKGDSLSGTEELLTTTPEDNPLVVQLFGAEPEFLADAIALLRERGFRFFDLNMGCSVPKVTKTGAGASLLRDPGKALVAAKAVFQAAGPGMAGCKLRLGWDSASPVYLSLSQALEDAGAAWITLHPRYARQRFGGNVERSALASLAATLRIPVLASGDLFTVEDAARCLETGVKGLMFARGAMANPEIFLQYRHFLESGEAVLTSGDTGMAPERLLAVILRHAELARRFTPGNLSRGGHSPALLKMRTAVPRYVRHLPGVKRLRLALVRCGSWEELDGTLRDFFESVALRTCP